MLLGPLLLLRFSFNAAAPVDCRQQDKSFEMSIRVDLIFGSQPGEAKKETENNEFVEEEGESEALDDASLADSGVDPGQEDQVDFEIRLLEKMILKGEESECFHCHLSFEFYNSLDRSSESLVIGVFGHQLISEI